MNSLQASQAAVTVTVRNDNRVGRIPVRVTFDRAISDGAVVNLSSIPWHVSVTAVEGLEQIDEQRYQIQSGSGEAVVRYEIQLRQPRVAGTEFDDPIALDAGDWAVVETNEMVPLVNSRRPDAAVETSGPGHTTQYWTYLGEHETVSRTVNGEEMRLVIPAASHPVTRPSTILDQLAATNRELPFGGRSDSVTLLSLPSRNITTPWKGIASGNAVIVRGGRPATTRPSTWVHEYVHTRQNFITRTTTRTEWLTEASADYYSSHETLHQRRQSYNSFQASNSREEFRGAVLADSESWSSPLIPYVKGRRALAYLDARIRQETDGDRTLADVFRRLNEGSGTITLSTFYETVASVGSPTVAEAIQPYIEGSELAPMVNSEYTYLRNSNSDADGDGVQNSAERNASTHPFIVDTDGDGLSDRRELFDLGTNATNNDTDGDGRSDAAELTPPRSDPTVADTDGDGLNDRQEVVAGTDPTIKDTDDDGLNDTAELEVGASPRRADTDGDGLDDATEVEIGTDPTTADTDGDGLGDATELAGNTSPVDADTDNDTFGDRAELAVGTDPTEPTSRVEYLTAYLTQILSGLL